MFRYGSVAEYPANAGYSATDTTKRDAKFGGDEKARGEAPSEANSAVNKLWWTIRDLNP